MNIKLHKKNKENKDGIWFWKFCEVPHASPKLPYPVFPGTCSPQPEYSRGTPVMRAIKIQIPISVSSTWHMFAHHYQPPHTTSTSMLSTIPGKYSPFLIYLLLLTTCNSTSIITTTMLPHPMTAGKLNSNNVNASSQRRPTRSPHHHQHAHHSSGKRGLDLEKPKLL